MPTYYQSPTGNLREDFYQRQGYYPTPAPTMREGVESMGRDALLAGLNAGKLAGEALIPQSPTDLGIMFASSALGPVGLLGRGMRAADDRCEVVILDDHARWFVPKHAKLAPSWFLDAVIWSNRLPDPAPKL